MKKLLACLLLLSLIIVSVSACGSKEATPPTSSPSLYKYLEGGDMRAAAGDQKVTLDWQMYPGAATYNIYYIAKAGSSAPNTDEMKAGSKLTISAGVDTVSALSSPLTQTNGIVAGVISATFEINHLVNDTQYWFSFAPIDSAGVENYMTMPTKATPTSSVPLPPSKPENFRANAGNAKVTVTWDPVADADHYLLYCYWQEGLTADVGTISIPGQSSQEQIVDSTTMNWTYDTANPGVENNRTYYFYIYALTASNVPSNSSFVTSATPRLSPPPPAPLLTTTSTGSSSAQQIYLAWTAPATHTGTVTYAIYYGKAKGVTKTTGAKWDAGDATAGYMTSLDSGTKYYFVITATDNNGESAESNEKSAVAH